MIYFVIFDIFRIRESVKKNFYNNFLIKNLIKKKFLAQICLEKIKDSLSFLAFHLYYFCSTLIPFILIFQHIGRTMNSFYKPFQLVFIKLFRFLPMTMCALYCACQLVIIGLILIFIHLHVKYTFYLVTELFS